MRKRNILELEWAGKKNERKYNELVKSMSNMAVGDVVEHMQLEEMMSNLGVESMGEVGLWEVEED